MDQGLTFDHIGYAVANIEQYLRDFFVPLFQPSSVGVVVCDPVQHVRVTFVELSGNIRIELIEPLGQASPVRQILEDRRGGLYHVCYSVDYLDIEIDHFKRKGCILVSGPTPAPAFSGRCVVFLYTPQSDLIELVENAAEHKV